jgi:uncharacterized protein (DUF58 family)
METSRALTRTLRRTPAQRARRALGFVTPLAWLVLAIGAAAFGVGRRYGWYELTVLSATLLAALLFSIGFTVGRAQLAVGVELQPQRVRAGERAAASVSVGNASGGRLLGARMELTVGEGVAEFRVPVLGPGEAHEEVFVLPTLRRAVIPIGPATSVRSDPLGLLRNVQSWTEPIPLFVHPRTVALAELGSGFVRDLEGRSTQQVSQADIAFHTLREYEPGDDRRFIHWLTSARVGELMVRQFIDTRRSHLAVVVDGWRNAYADPTEFETAVSAAASLGVRVLLDDQQVSMVVAGERIPTASGTAMLDALCTVETGGRASAIATEVHHLFRFASGLSLAVVITGSQTSVADLRAAATRFPSDVRVLCLRVDHASTTALQPIGSQLLLTLADLDDLPQLLWAVAS